LSKIFITIIFAFFYIYTGIGASISTISSSYLKHYLIYFALFSILMYVLFSPVSFFNKTDKEKIEVYLVNWVDRYANITIAVFIILNIIPLIHPEFRLWNIFNPPPPDLIAQIKEISMAQDRTVIGQITFYLTLLITPFFYISLYKLRHKPFKLFFCLFLPIYLNYCATSYVARSTLFPAVLIYLITVYLYNYRARKILIPAVVILIPALFHFSARYVQLRLGVSEPSVSLAGSLESFVSIETSFSTKFDAVLLSDQRVDLKNYFLWIITMPLPGFMKGFFTPPLLNIEISEILLGIFRNEPGFYVELPNIVTESVYVFDSLFWVQAFFISFMIFIIYRLSLFSKQFSVFLLYNAFYLGYNLHRGGLGAVLPQFAGGYLLFYLFILYIILKLVRGKFN